MNESAKVAYVTHYDKTCHKLPKHFFKYNPSSMIQINRKQRNFQQKYWIFMGKSLSNYDKWYIILLLNNFSKSNIFFFKSLMTGFVGGGHIKYWYSLGVICALTYMQTFWHSGYLGVSLLDMQIYLSNWVCNSVYVLLESKNSIWWHTSTVIYKEQ